MAKTPTRGRFKSPQFNKPAGKDYVPPIIDREPEPDFSLLTAEEKERIREEARVKVDATERDRAWEAFLAAEIKRLEKDLHPEAYEEEKEIEIDLAVYAPEILLDGKRYLYGRKYTVKKSVYDTLNEIMYRTKKHYADTHRDPARALQEAQQQIAKSGSSYAVINGSTGLVQRF